MKRAAPSVPVAVRVSSPAKLNLELAVCGRRPDGYHDLETILVALDLEDTLRVRRTESGTALLSLEGPAATADVPCDGSNLALRAASAVLELARERGRADARTGLALTLHKRVPSRAGLGGGSSNAAAAVLGGAAVLGLAARDDELLGILDGLGSDTSFFYAARATGFARCTGRGERVEEWPWLHPCWFVLLTPAGGAATSRVFETLQIAEHGGASRLRPELLGESPETVRAALRNDLEPAALRLLPELGRLFADLERAGGGHFRLSGSGSSVFGFFRERLAAEAFLESWLVAGKARDYGLRGKWVVRPAGHGVRITESSSQMGV